jgi:hypothetical protein
MIATYSTTEEISLGLFVHNITTMDQIAAPAGFARLITAVAITRPFLVNHVSEKRVGALRTRDYDMPKRA